MIDGIFSLLGMILGKFDKLDDMFQEDPVLLPIMFALIVFLLNFSKYLISSYRFRAYWA